MQTSTRPALNVTATIPAGYTDCRLCGSRLIANRVAGKHKDDLQHGLCAECHDRPEARRFLGPAAIVPTVGRPAAAAAAVVKQPRGFNAAEKALIRNVHSFMPSAQLLDILNTRLVADVGAAAVPFTLEQLQAEVQQYANPAGADDWAGLRDILMRARRCGLLAEITVEIINDFAVVWQLSPAQHMHVRDVIRSAQEER